MVINLYGGPAHGKRVRLHDVRIGYICYKEERGHYARVHGGLDTNFYWYECPPPIAINNTPIKEVDHGMVEEITGD